MDSTLGTPSPPSRATPGRGQSLLQKAQLWKTFALGIIILVVFILCVPLAPAIAPYNPDKPDYTALLQPPSREHLFGTDDKGRDIFSRVVFGTRVSFTIALVSVGLATLLGLLVVVGRDRSSDSSRGQPIVLGLFGLRLGGGFDFLCRARLRNCFTFGVNDWFDDWYDASFDT